MASASHWNRERLSGWWEKSGCGKNHSRTGGDSALLSPPPERFLLAGEEISSLSESGLRARRRKFQMIFQDPYGSLNPRC